MDGAQFGGEIESSSGGLHRCAGVDARTTAGQEAGVTRMAAGILLA